MNCEEVKNRLSDYLDKTLDVGMMTRIATHLISCSPCRAESNELADCIQQVATLPMIDPPLGFAQRVMAHVHELEPKPSIWERLFLPLTKNIPLQATAVVLVTILAALLYQKEQPINQNDPVNLALRSAAPAPTVEKEAAPAQDSSPGNSQLKQEINPAVKAPAQRAEGAGEETLPKNSTAGRSPPEQAQTASSPSSKAEVETRLQDISEAPRKPPIRVQEVTTAREPDSFSGGAGVFPPPIPLGALRQAAPRAAAPMAMERSASPVGDRTADIEFVVRRRPPQRLDQTESSNADSLRKSTDASAIPSGSAARRAGAPAATPKIESIAEIRFYNVAPEHYEIFKKELAGEAHIESESKASARGKEAAQQSDRQLLIKVTILPPEPTAEPSR